MLQQVAALISSHRPSTGSAVRMGGEEFLVIMPDTDESSALARCDRLRRAIANHPWSKITSGIPVTVSIGIATIHDGATTMSASLSAADRTSTRQSTLGATASSQPRLRL